MNEAVNLNSITYEISSGINEMSIGTDEITIAVNKINDLTEENKCNIESLEKEVSKFKV